MNSKFNKGDAVFCNRTMTVFEVKKVHLLYAGSRAATYYYEVQGKNSAEILVRRESDLVRIPDSAFKKYREDV